MKRPSVGESDVDDQIVDTANSYGGFWRHHPLLHEPLGVSLVALEPLGSTSR